MPENLKRSRNDEDGRLSEAEAASVPAQAPDPPAVVAPVTDGAVGGDGEEDDDEPLQGRRRGARAVVPGDQCPFLDTIARQTLDFDFEKCCSVSLSRVNVYACLVCGAYFQGRGPGTHAHTHSVERGHHLFMRLDSGAVFCVPEGYEVADRSFKDIQHVLRPTFTAAERGRMDALTWARTLDGGDYMPGLVGLNNAKRADYANVVLQALARVPRLRDFFLVPENCAGIEDAVVLRFGELMRKLWNPRAFRGQVSPHELLQAVLAASARRFTADAEADPVDFWAWLLNALHRGLTRGRLKRPSIITECFQGQLEVTTITTRTAPAVAGGEQLASGTDGGTTADGAPPATTRVPFLVLALDLPPARLFQDAMDANIIPQIALHELLQKYGGERETEDAAAGTRRRFRVTRLPPYVALAVRRFTRNRFFVEKNPTIVNFPLRGLDFRAVLPRVAAAAAPAAYDLAATVSHIGAARPEGRYVAYVQRASEGPGAWYEARDLGIREALPEAVAITEAYFLLYTRRPAKAKARVAAAPRGVAPGGA